MPRAEKVIVLIRVRTYIKRIALRLVSHWIKRKTALSKIQSSELASSLVHTLYAINGLHFRRNQTLLRVMFDRINWKEFCLTEEQFHSELRSITYNKDYREPIGIWFTIDSEETYSGAPKIQNTDRVTYYASGREPFLAVANHISPERKVVLMPYFTCVTVHQPFNENGWKIVFYKVSKDLKIDTQDVELLYEQHKPAMAVFMEYSAMDLTEDELRVIGKLKRAGCVTVVDRSQNIYSETRSEEVDFYCGSLRKWFCCPDGAYLEKNGDISLPPVPNADDHNDVYATACAAMMFANGLARKRKIIQYRAMGFFFRKLSAAYVCGQPVRTRSMSEYAKAVYLQERSKDDVYIRRRKENFEYIFRRIEAFSTMCAVCSDFSRFNSVPLYFHIYTEDRSKLSKYLMTKGVATLINWNRPKCFGVLDEQTEYIFQHILSLPCDQRYTQDDMKIMCDALEAYELEHRVQQ